MKSAVNATRVRTYVPTTDELNTEIEAIRKEFPGCDWKKISATLLKKNETWNVTERKIAKLAKRKDSNNDDQSVSSSSSFRSFFRKSAKQSSEQLNKNDGDQKNDKNQAPARSKGSLRSFFAKTKKSTTDVPKDGVSPQSKALSTENGDDASVTSKGSVRSFFSRSSKKTEKNQVTADAESDNLLPPLKHCESEEEEPDLTVSSKVDSTSGKDTRSNEQEGDQIKEKQPSIPSPTEGVLCMKDGNVKSDHNETTCGGECGEGKDAVTTVEASMCTRSGKDQTGSSDDDEWGNSTPLAENENTETKETAIREGDEAMKEKEEPELPTTADESLQDSEEIVSAEEKGPDTENAESENKDNIPEGKPKESLQYANDIVSAGEKSVLPETENAESGRSDAVSEGEPMENEEPVIDTSVDEKEVETEELPTAHVSDKDGESPKIDDVGSNASFHADTSYHQSNTAEECIIPDNHHPISVDASEVNSDADVGITPSELENTETAKKNSELLLQQGNEKEDLKTSADTENPESDDETSEINILYDETDEASLESLPNIEEFEVGSKAALNSIPENDDVKANLVDSADAEGGGDTDTLEEDLKSSPEDGTYILSFNSDDTADEVPPAAGKNRVIVGKCAESHTEKDLLLLRDDVSRSSSDESNEGSEHLCEADVQECSGKNKKEHQIPCNSSLALSLKVTAGLVLGVGLLILPGYAPAQFGQIATQLLTQH